MRIVVRFDATGAAVSVCARISSWLSWPHLDVWLFSSIAAFIGTKRMTCWTTATCRTTRTGGCRCPPWTGADADAADDDSGVAAACKSSETMHQSPRCHLTGGFMLSVCCGRHAVDLSHLLQRTSQVLQSMVVTYAWSHTVYPPRRE